MDVAKQVRRTPHGVRKPLAGVRVVDFSRLLPPAYCTWILATLGADVVKVEQPGKGDYQRDIGLRVGDRGSALYQVVNQGKRSIGLDLKNLQARQILSKLLNAADVVVESFRPGVAQRLGLDFDALRAERPSLVCLSVNGFGSNSPMRDVVGHDINYLAFSGLMNRQLQAGEGMPDVPLVDLIGGGLIPALSALALLFRARATGTGGIADASLADAIPLLPYEALMAALLGLPEQRKQDAQFAGALANYAVYALRDGYVAVGAVEEQFWRELCTRMHLEFTGASDDRQQLSAVKEELARKFRSMTRSEVEVLFRGADACVTVVRSYSEALASEHARVRQYVGSPPAAGTMPRLGSPFFHDGRREFAEGPAPLLGEHSIAVMNELGYAESEIAALVGSGVLAVATPPETSREDRP